MMRKNTVKTLMPGWAVAIVCWLCTFICGAAQKEVHDHVSMDIGAGTPVPSVFVQAFRDANDGININVVTENYHLNAPLDPELCRQPLKDGILQGHAHIFVNGEKKQRLYANNVHIPAAWLRKGLNQIAVSLNSHQHANWTIDGKLIVGSVFIDVDREPITLYRFSS